jgi:hypothetical protein
MTDLKAQRGFGAVLCCAHTRIPNETIACRGSVEHEVKGGNEVCPLSAFNPV